MTTTYERWKRNRPVLDSLPGINGGYSDNAVADWLSQPVDDLLIGLKASLDNFDQQLDPLTCDERWLDFLAPICGWVSPYWDASWAVASKRQLLNASYTLIWPKKGSRETLSFILDTLGVTHRIREGSSFIVGASEVGDPLGSVAWQYDIILPTGLFNSAEAKLTKRIDEQFGPLWCKSRILFDDEFFAGQGFLAIGDQLLLAVDDEQTVLGL